MGRRDVIGTLSFLLQDYLTTSNRIDFCIGHYLMEFYTIIKLQRTFLALLGHSCTTNFLSS